MDIVEFVESCLKLKLTEYQKELLLAYHNYGSSGKFISVPIRSGKTSTVKIITEYERGVYNERQ